MRWATLINKYKIYAAFFMLCTAVWLLQYLHHRETIPERNIYSNTEYHFYSRWHYGDNINNLKFLYNISEHLRKRNKVIHYYYNDNYIKNRDELERYVNKDTMVLHTLDKKPDHAIGIWILDTHNGKMAVPSYDEYYGEIYKRLVNYMGLGDLGIDTSYYQKEEYLLKIYEKLPDKFKNVEILFINAEPKNGQYPYNKKRADAIAVELSKRYRIVTTSPVNDEIPCTFTDGLKLQDIGAVSTHAKYIIGVNSGPIIPCMNYYTKQSVKKWIFVSYEKFTQIPWKRIYDYNRLKEIVISEIEGTS